MTPEQEGQIIGRYLLKGSEPSEKSVWLYSQALQKRPLIISTQQEKEIRFALKNTFLLSFCDSALAFGNNHHPLRRKLLYMTAILETQPEYSDLFLTHERPFTYIFKIIYTGISAVVKMILGKIILVFV